MLLSLDDYEAPEYKEPPRDVEDRLGARLEEAERNVTGTGEEEGPSEAEIEREAAESGNEAPEGEELFK